MSFLRRHSDSIPSPFPQYLHATAPFRRKSRQSSTDSNDSTFSTSSTASTLTNNSIHASSSNNPFHRSPTPVPAALVTNFAISPPSPDSKFLSGHTSRIHCAKCSTDLCLSSQIISKGFVGRHGRAYLVQGTPSHIYTSTANLPNTYQEKAVPRNLVTGQHMVSNVSCAICGVCVGWKYVAASEEGQRYKVGKYILETKRVRVGVGWENWDEDDDIEELLPLPPDQLRSLDGLGRGGGGGGGAGIYAKNRSRNSSRSPARTRSPSPSGVKRGTAKNLEDIEFDSQDEDECEDLFSGVWSPQLAIKRRQERDSRIMNKKAAIEMYRSRNASEDTLGSR
ncbi:yippee-like protein [Cyphellophora attinorum]|uniref:Yippee-like protein n=1 Tax=Cyphellophora attinorum TaxID=1664694 RepID=A0A0N1H8H4_9EURO|nr:yippee-like protein [Phialophora attinorum]KPI39434.1 yippee-like protein [Phialophora attinorum]